MMHGHMNVKEKFVKFVQRKGQVEKWSEQKGADCIGI
jgi:hypothetical protein